MIGVRKCRRERIIEHGRRLAEINAVLLEILLGLRRIPRERHRISLSAVRVLHAGCLMYISATAAHDFTSRRRLQMFIGRRSAPAFPLCYAARLRLPGHLTPSTTATIMRVPATACTSISFT